MRFFVFIYRKNRMKRVELVGDKKAECEILLPKDDFSLDKTEFLQFKNISGEWFVRETERCHLNREEFFQMEKQKSNEGIFYKLVVGRKNELLMEGRSLYIQVIRYRDNWSMYTKYKLRECQMLKEKNMLVIKQNTAGERSNISILYENDKWMIKKCGNIEAYINELLVEKQQQLEFGDIIYIGTIQFLFLEKYIAVEAGERSIISEYLEEVILEDQIKGYVQKYRKREMAFHRSPRVMEEIKEISLKIDAPPKVNIQEKKSVFMDIGTIMNMMLPMLGMNVFLIYGMKAEQNQTGIYIYSGLVMSVISAACSILWIMISRRHEKQEKKRKIHKEFLAYRKYLNKKSEYVRCQYERTHRVLQSRYLRADAYLDTPLLEMYLWNRNPYHKDFLMYRIGVGNTEFPMKIEFPEEAFGDEENVLWREAKKIQEHYQILYQIPILLDMERYSQIGIITKDISEGMKLVRSIILQISLCNCYTEVKVGCIYDRNKVIQSKQWEFCRWLPHIWDANKQRRFIAENAIEARQLCYDLLQIFKEREGISISGKSEKIFPHYILFVAEERFLEGEMLSKYIFDRGKDYGVTVVWLDSVREKLPNTCKLVLEINKRFTGWYEIERHSQKKEEVNFDYTKKEVADRLIRSISGIRVVEIEEKRGIPEVVDFLGMYDVHTIEELNIEQRWEKNRIFESARVLIGKKAGEEPFYLDIHERYHGPHGLLAGTTGSGKSEVLQTFILSMAVNFSPDAVSFLLIDYKGEGMSALFSDLPHISGKISNLSEGQAHRAMISIKSENKRRQKIFKECKVNNINDYIKLFNSGSVSEPIPHLLIIIDEFAELKKAEPEFMQELISVAQVGRSLGVHLLLATQKPGGVVDDKIWSNSRFRICLKVQEREDSMDMLHNVDACQITQTGRGYLQVGNNEVYELFQAGWSGALFERDNKEVAAHMIKTDGTIYKRKRNAEKSREKKITQLQAVKQYIIHLAKEQNHKTGRKLWMEPLAQYVYLNEINRNKKLKGESKETEIYRRMEVCVGIFDDPENQEQPIFSLNLMESGHIGICGRSISGKSTFFQTFLFSLLKDGMEEVCLYLLDFNGSGMEIYAQASQVRQVIKEEEENKVEELFESMQEEIKRRKKKFSGGNFNQYRDKKSKDKEVSIKRNKDGLNKTEEKKEEFPLILIILDGYVEFCEATYQRYEESLYLILREGEKLGIKVMISIESFSGIYISTRIAELFKTKICLYMKDKYAYTEAFDMMHISVFPKAGVPGRGIACCGERILEFQTALAVNIHNDYERQEKIKELLGGRARDDIC